MDSYKDIIVVDTGGNADEYVGREKRRHIRFPVCLSVKYGENIPDICADFILNISKSGVFIHTDTALKVGSRIIMHFYIPPDKKLLAEFTGEVVAVNTDNSSYPAGMHVKFLTVSQEDLKRLEDFLEEKKHLIDETA